MRITLTVMSIIFLFVGLSMYVARSIHIETETEITANSNAINVTDNQIISKTKDEIAVEIKTQIYKYPTKYDADIKKATKLYLPGIDWKLLKAQYYQESKLNPLAVSPVGASGVAQFMPATWSQMQKELNITASPQEAEYAILAGAYYMAKLRKSWDSPRPWEDRMKLAQASYNAGLGNILKSQKKSNGAILYKPIIDQLHLVTGRHSDETKTYVIRIWNYYPMMSL